MCGEESEDPSIPGTTLVSVTALNVFTSQHLPRCPENESLVSDVIFKGSSPGALEGVRSPTLRSTGCGDAGGGHPYTFDVNDISRCLSNVLPSCNQVAGFSKAKMRFLISPVCLFHKCSLFQLQGTPLFLHFSAIQNVGSAPCPCLTRWQMKMMEMLFSFFRFE